MDIAELLMLTVEKNGSDLHLNVGAPTLHPCSWRDGAPGVSRVYQG